MLQAEALVRELAEMRVKALPSGFEQFGARDGEHARALDGRAGGGEGASGAGGGSRGTV